MKKIIIFCLTTIFFSCKEESKSNEPICFYYTQTIQDTTTVDTIPFRGFIRIDSLGELLATEKFKYNNTYHQIKMFSTDKYAPIDGGELYYTLDNIYCMYSRSTCWSNFGILSSNNDSINEILKVAIGNIMMYPSMHCFYCSDKYTHIPEEKLPPIIVEY